MDFSQHSTARTFLCGTSRAASWSKCRAPCWFLTTWDYWPIVNYTFIQFSKRSVLIKKLTKLTLACNESLLMKASILVRNLAIRRSQISFTSALTSSARGISSGALWFIFTIKMCDNIWEKNSAIWLPVKKEICNLHVVWIRHLSEQWASLLCVHNLVEFFYLYYIYLLKINEHLKKIDTTTYRRLTSRDY